MSTHNLYPLSAEPTKMVKNTQKIGRQIHNKLFKCVWPFCGVGI